MDWLSWLIIIIILAASRQQLLISDWLRRNS
jgi:hypothetical protein